MAKTTSPATRKNTSPKSDFSFGRINYILMLSGLGLILLGFILMAGGKSDDPNVFNPDVFSFRRITLAPIIVLSGFALNIFAILKKSKD
jgi:hypothetical protein